MTRIRREIHALALLHAMLLTGCASTPPPTGLLDAARSAVDGAREARADDYAPVELGFAEERLAAADAAMQQGEYAQAREHAARAELDAALAKAKSRAAAGREAVRRQTDENARLRHELLGSGDRP